jgi:hypothetical protein
MEGKIIIQIILKTYTMSYNLVLNSNNAIHNSTFQYQFINGSFAVHDEAELAISNIQIPYSWFNVTKAYNNNTVTLTFPSLTPTILTITFPDGFYTTTDLNAYIQQICIQNGLYLINASGQYVYYLTLLYNTTYYGVQVVAQLVPTSLPSGYSQPANWVGYNTISRTPQLTISSNNFGKIIGFLPGTYPSVNTANASILNTFTPIGSNVNSLIIRCSLVDNQVGIPTDVLDTMPVTGSFGSNISYQPPSLKWIKITPGIYQYLTITFVDQNLNAISAQDPNVTISLLLKNKGKEIKEKVIPKLNITL